MEAVFQRGLWDENSPVHVHRCDLLLTQLQGQFSHLALRQYPLVVCFWLADLHGGGFAQRESGDVCPRHGAAGVVGDGVAGTFYRLLQYGLVVQFDSLELEVALPGMEPLVVFRQGVKLLGVEVAHSAQVERVEDDIGVVGIHVLLKLIYVLGGEGAVLALIASPLMLPGRGPWVRLWPLLCWRKLRWTTRIPHGGLHLAGDVHLRGSLLCRTTPGHLHLLLQLWLPLLQSVRPDHAGGGGLSPAGHGLAQLHRVGRVGGGRMAGEGGVYLLCGGSAVAGSADGHCQLHRVTSSDFITDRPIYQRLPPLQWVWHGGLTGQV